jgi:hypothetical protein
MAFATVATEIAAYGAGLTLIGGACYTLFLLIKSFTWGRRVTK